MSGVANLTPEQAETIKAADLSREIRFSSRLVAAAKAIRYPNKVARAGMPPPAAGASPASTRRIVGFIAQ